jgi:hypothetical protein
MLLKSLEEDRTTILHHVPIHEMSCSISGPIAGLSKSMELECHMKTSALWGYPTDYKSLTSWMMRTYCRRWNGICSFNDSLMQGFGYAWDLCPSLWSKVGTWRAEYHTLMGIRWNFIVGIVRGTWASFESTTGMNQSLPSVYSRRISFSFLPSIFSIWYLRHFVGPFQIFSRE